MNKPEFPSAAFWNHVVGFALVGAALSVYFQESLGGCGDYPEHFVLLYKGMALGAVAGLIFNLVWAKIPNTFIVQPTLVVLIRYYLAFIIFSYGFAKVFAGQFPHTMANMDARFAELSPMRVAWAFFGYSRGYQEFLGWGEVVPALLLLFRRTALLGALMMFIVMLNVFLINIFFDVCVKINSGIYTALSFYLLLQEFPRLWSFFIGNTSTPARVDVKLENPRWLWITGRVLNYLLLGYVIYTTGEGAYNYYKYSQVQVTETPLQGAWKTVKTVSLVDSVEVNLEPADSLLATRLFFDGNNGVIRSDFIRDRFRFSLDSIPGHITVRFTNPRNEWNIPPVTWQFIRPHPDTLLVTGPWKGKTLRMTNVLRKEKLTRY
ncbi:MAG TPA: hypothetical protein PLX35_02960 [Cyclobacteriaceae bacterium]|nr:hypothetical protein [Cyclobacteriaceae bacterium]